ncbi:MAG: S8 family serine peptidase [Inquilinus sp.]|nr:S8 family serine peptidase [Inquilinus sp.]
MAKHNPKIVVLKEGKIGLPEAADEVLKAASIKRDHAQDSVSVMQSDYKPAELDVMSNPTFGYFTADLTDAEVVKLQESADVEEVVDDEVVFAFDPDVPAGGTMVRPEEDIGEDFDEALLEHDSEETRALQEELDQSLAAPMEEPSAEDIAHATQAAPSVTEDLIAIEHALVGMSQGFAPDVALPPGVWPSEMAPVVRGVLETLREQNRTPEQVSDEELGTLLRGRAAPAALAAGIDIILPNIRMIFANLAWRYSQGLHARVAIMDTGISRHIDLRPLGGVSFVPGVASWHDDHGHGTHVSGTAAAIFNGTGIVGVAPRSSLYAVKVLNRAGSGMKSWILNGLAWCYYRRMHVVNMSLGSNYHTHDPSKYDTLYERYGRILRSRGILIVAAAGNNYRKPVANPARCPSYMAVSAIDYQRRFASFSSIGPQVEICAPGVNILSTVPGNSYAMKSGTSMATPHVTGTAALRKSRFPSLSGDAIRWRIRNTALDLGTPGHDWFYGFGQVNAYRAVL